MRINLLFGFLGAGKTTLVRKLIADGGSALKTAVIVNEFGEVGVDGQILSGSNVDIVELTSGCLCCTLKGSLILAIEELRDMAKVERVIVEATGVAQPAEMLDTLTDAGDDLKLEIGPLVTVVDAAKLPKLLPMLGEFYASQIVNADIVVLNKVDLVTPELLDAASAQIRQLNAAADILFAEQGDVDNGYLLDGRTSSLLDRVRAAAPGDAAHAHGGHGDETSRPHEHHAAHAPHGGPPVESFVLAAGGNPGRAEVEVFFGALADSVWRVKGHMTIGGEASLVQYTMGQLEITPATVRPADNIVFIGRGMDRRAIQATFRFAQAG